MRSPKRGHVYVTNVYDHKSRRLLWSVGAAPGKRWKAFLDWLGKERAEQLEGVCCDMWQPCIDAIKTSASKAILVS